MIAYPDTSFLCALYRLQSNSLPAAEHFAAMPEPLHVASPLLFEFRQSMRWQAYWHARDVSKGFARETAQASLAKLQANLAAGALVIVPTSPAWLNGFQPSARGPMDIEPLIFSMWRPRFIWERPNF